MWVWCEVPILTPLTSLRNDMTCQAFCRSIWCKLLWGWVRHVPWTVVLDSSLGGRMWRAALPLIGIDGLLTVCERRELLFQEWRGRGRFWEHF